MTIAEPTDVIRPKVALDLRDSAAEMSFVGKEVRWTKRGSTDHLLHHINVDDIILVLGQKNDPSTGYSIFTLVEDAENAEAPFQLEVVNSKEPPSEILEQHLLTETPIYLQDDWDLSVVVSVKSGTGLAKVFYTAVVQPLLAALGLYASDDVAAPKPADNLPQAAGKALRYHVLTTDSAQSVRQFARRTFNGPASSSATEGGRGQTILLLSGDGGVVDLLNGAADDEGGPRAPHQRRPRLVLLPLGTGNALFHSLHRQQYLAAGAGGGPSPHTLGLRTLLGGRSAPLPTFRASFSPGSHLVPVPDAPAEDLQLETGAIGKGAPPVSHLVGAIVASYGFHASLVWESDTAEYRRHGDKRFGMAAAGLLETSHAYDAAVEVAAPGSAGLRALAPGRRLAYVLAAMVSNLERTFTINPAARPLDQRLRLVHFGAVGGGKTMEIMQAAYRNGAHVGMRWTGSEGHEEAVGYEEVDEVKVTVLEDDARWRKVCVDGTIVELQKGGWMSVRREPEAMLDIVVDSSVF